MNELDQLTRFRDEVPLAVTPRAERLFRAGLQENHYPERIVASRPRNPLTRIRTPWRLGISAFVAAALAAGILVAVLPGGASRQSGTAVLTARLLADRASAAALTQPTVSPGQWVYRVAEWTFPNRPKGAPYINTQAGWETADGTVSYGDNSASGAGGYMPSYSQLGSLPRDPRALDAYLAHRVYPHSKPAADIMGLSAFNNIDQMLSNYVLPPTLSAEMYQALADIPSVEVDSHVTAIDGQEGVAFVLPATPQSEKHEIILDASTYRYLADAHWYGNSLQETAIVRMTIVGGPGSTKPSLTPPTAAELLAEQADRAVSYSSGPPQVIKPGTWIMRKLATSSGDQTVWATADDSEQASYTGGQLQVCSRTAACAKSTRWLMPAGPSYKLVYPTRYFLGRPPHMHPVPALPQSLPQLLTTLNSYRTGCADVAGDCNAVNAMTNILAGYASMWGPQGSWFLMLADIPGVTVRPVTDVTGQRDVALHFPFADGVTDILFNASTHQFAGYVRDGAETLITKQVTVSEPGSTTPVVFRPRYAPLPKG
ncbi:MAG TPA: CU044_5270 family protein [Trebonia sp.]